MGATAVAALGSVSTLRAAGSTTRRAEPERVRSAHDGTLGDVRDRLDDVQDR
jgi:hypothetical protein